MDSSLDVKDRKILYQLETNARQSTAAIAKNVGLSREVVNYRIKQLEKRGIIQYYVTTIDLIKLGLMYCRVFFKYDHVDKEVEQQIIDFSYKNKYITWVALGVGHYDLALVYSVNNINLLEKHYQDFQFRFGQYFKRTYPSVAFKIYHFKNTYLYKDNKDRIPVIVGEGGTTFDIDDVDWKILHALMANPRATYVELSKSAGLNIKTLTKRIELLDKKRIIMGYRAKINTRILGFEHHKVFLFMENFARQEQQELIAFLQSTANIIFITVPFGMADLEFEIIVKGQRELYEFINNLSTRFPHIVRDYESFLLYDEPFTNYVPE